MLGKEGGTTNIWKIPYVFCRYFLKASLRNNLMFSLSHVSDLSFLLFWSSCSSFSAHCFGSSWNFWCSFGLALRSYITCIHSCLAFIRMSLIFSLSHVSVLFSVLILSSLSSIINSTVSFFLLFIFCYRIQDTWYMIQDTWYRIHDTGYRIDYSLHWIGLMVFKDL